MFEQLLKAVLDEYQSNLEHDTKECTAWNALIRYAMELEKGKVTID